MKSFNRNDSLFDTMDILNFILSLLNLNENLGQSDKQDLMSEFDNVTTKAILQLQNHLKLQDDKLNKILAKLEGLK